MSAKQIAAKEALQAEKTASKLSAKRVSAKSED
jgi:hypothetical protein